MPACDTSLLDIDEPLLEILDHPDLVDGPRAAECIADDSRLRGGEVLEVHQLAPELAGEMRSAGLVVFVGAITTIVADHSRA